MNIRGESVSAESFGFVAAGRPLIRRRIAAVQGAFDAVGIN
jgi:hypothetical protein